MLVATKPTAAPADEAPKEDTGEGGTGDKSLPDPSPEALKVLAGLLAVAVGAAVLINLLGWTNKPWSPPEGDFNFALFAAFYAGAQIIERLMELVAPLLPVFPPGDAEGDVLAAHVKADRAKVALGVTSLLGVVASGVFGLFFLQTIGIEASNTVDTLVSGLLIGAGTKPLHDFIDLLQDQNNPKTGTAAK